jgi:hypothetical protein
MHVVYTHCCGLGSGAKTAETICYIQYMVLGSLSSVYIKPESTGKKWVKPILLSIHRPFHDLPRV